MDKEKNIYKLFCLAYTAILAFSILSNIEMIKLPLYWIRNFSILILIGIILFRFKSYTKDELIKGGVATLISLIIGVKTRNLNIVKIMLILLAMKNIDFKKFIKYDVKMRIVMMISLIIFYNYGLAIDKISLESGVYKHSYGFENPNSFAMQFLIVFLEILYIVPKSKFLYTFFITCGIGEIISFNTGCRTLRMMLVLISIAVVLSKYMDKILNNKFIKSIVCNSALIFSLINFICFIIYKNFMKLGDFVNSLVGNRFAFADVYSSVFDIKLFGNNLTSLNLTLDNIYLYVIYSLGIVFFGLFIVAFNKLFKNLYNMKDIRLIVIIELFLLYGFMERLWFNIDYNVFIMMFSYVLYDKYNNKEKSLK